LSDIAEIGAMNDYLDERRYALAADPGSAARRP
jgi:hypothetical protein